MRKFNADADKGELRDGDENADAEREKVEDDEKIKG